MSDRFPPGLEIMGYGTLDPAKYMDTRRKYNCPLKELAANITGTNFNTYCSKSCAWWSEAKRRCGIIK